MEYYRQTWKAMDRNGQKLIVIDTDGYDITMNG